MNDTRDLMQLWSCDKEGMQSNVDLKVRNTSPSEVEFDPPGFIHWSPLNIVVDVLSPLQPLPQHGSGVVHVVIRRSPETSDTG